MSWLTGYKSKPSTSESEADSREAKRNKLEADRLQRTQQREATKRQLLAAQESREQATKALQELLNISTDIFDGEETLENEQNISDLSDDSEIIMVDFDKQNEEDVATALDNLRTVHCPFNKEDIEFWFCQLEDQLTLIGVKKQWTKKIALTRFLPMEIQVEVKSLLKLQQTAAGVDIYFKIKRQLLKLYGPKPEDAYTRAKNRVLTGKPSQLGKLLLEDICTGDTKLDGCHCANTVWGMFREKIPIIIRNHIADMPFNKDTYESVFDKADQVWDSNKGSEPLTQNQVSAIESTSEVAAVQKSQNNKNKGQNRQNRQNGQSNKNQNQNQGGSQKNKNENQPEKNPVNEESLCRIHAKWKKDAHFCAAPWACKMKNIWKAPQ